MIPCFVVIRSAATVAGRTAEPASTEESVWSPHAAATERRIPQVTASPTVYTQHTVHPTRTEVFTHPLSLSGCSCYTCGCR